ncbi:methylmalonyl-CoA mutase [Aeromicrobium camelliae]|uniref:Methylmalonyl-CoA mutase n=1 Tax=Aeromicrobium camelliae TaxID=1538144 RepID=A0A3N6WXK7_9ACTN|nr:methylmalonyl-CoA mutase family protein [Aeromicrobium camelliae]RQN09772.1 methylmalonyl-CoA mutase [Aeromicrobium camelliae]
MAPEQTVPLAEGVSHDLAEWEKATAAVLRKTRKLAEDAPDSDVWDLLATRTLDGISVTPLGTPALTEDLPEAGLPGQSPFTRGAVAARTELDGWDVRGWFIDPSTDADAVSAELENGANSLWLTVGEEGIAPDRLAALLEPVFLDLAPVILDAPTATRAAAEAFLSVLEDKAVEAHRGTNLGADPLGNALRGRGDTALDVAVDLARIAKARGIRGVVVDATAAHDLGASDVQELAYSLYAGVTYLRALTEAGLSANEAAEQLEFRYAATDEQFPTIAKLRAARRLWDRVGQLSEIVEPARAQRQHAVTSRPMMCRYDSYTNMLRTTVATFAAGVGGADAVTTLPFDEPLGLPTPFSRRIARNTSALLISESHVAAVTDPAGGAHAVEKLTDDIARAAWELFGELDAADGTDAALAILRDRIEATASERALQIARRKRPITGVSEFPNLQEKLPERAPYPVPLAVHRYAGEFEAMRDEPAEQPVFLATMGPIAQHTARASFAANLLAAGGIHHAVAGATDGVEQVIDSYREAGGPEVVCVAGHDNAYDEWGAELVTALRKAGARHVIVAGKTDIGADDSVAAGLDALAFLRRTREVLSA